MREKSLISLVLLILSSVQAASSHTWYGPSEPVRNLKADRPRLCWASPFAASLWWLPGSLHTFTASRRVEMQDDLFPHDPQDGFFAGEYSIIGQRPAGGVAYKGRAKMEMDDQHQIRLSRTVGGRTTVVTGKFVPGGELKKKCLQFNWKDSRGAAEMFCQYSVDFDNYPRLSCVWSYTKRPSDQLPGLESYYPFVAMPKGGVFSANCPNPLSRVSER